MTADATRARIGLMGPFGYGNLGDNASLDAVMENLRTRRAVDFVGFTLNPADTSERHGIPAFPLSRVAWQPGDPLPGPYGRLMNRLRGSEWSVVRRVERLLSRGPAEFGMLRRSHRALQSVDLLIACGSGQIQDYWAGGGPWSYPYTMLRWALLARLRRIPFVVMSVGAGPVDSPLSRRFFRWALALTEYRSFRDEWSREFVADVIGFDRDDPVRPDPAFGIHVPAIEDRRKGPAGRPTSGRIVGIGPIGYFREGTWPQSDDERWLRYLDAMAALVEAVVADGDAVVFLKGEAHYDQLVVDDLVDELRRRDVPLDRTATGTSISTVDDLLAALGDCDLVVAGRFHNVLLSYVFGRPVLSPAYQEKIEAIMGEADQTEFCLPIADADRERLVALYRRFRAQPDISDRLAEMIEQKRALLDEQYDHLIAIVDRR